MSHPLVSIVIPAYKARYLREAIASALAQDYPAIEIMVSDQCPDEQVRTLVDELPEIAYQRNPVPGVYSNFRQCIRIANGEFIKFLLDDDLLLPDCVEKMVAAFAKYPDATLVSGWYRLINEAGEEIQVRRMETDRTIVSSPGGAAPPMLMSARNPIGPLTTCMFRRRSLPCGLGPYFFHTGAPEQYFGLIDMTIILDLTFLGRTVVLPEVLSAMRMHPEQLSNPDTNSRLVHSIKSWLPLAEDAFAFGLLSRQQHIQALDTILAQFKRFIRLFPELADDAEHLQTRLESLRKSTPPSMKHSV